jgi:ATP-binding cassette subfamily A (ABC1) protein 1
LKKIHQQGSILFPFDSDNPSSSNIDQVRQNEIQNITSSFYNGPGLGARCMNNYKIVISSQVDSYRSKLRSTTLSCRPGNSIYQAASTVPSDIMSIISNNPNYSTTRLPPCNCSSGFPICDPSTTGDIEYREQVQLRTGDIMVNLTERNVSDWLLKTEFNKKYFQTCFGGFEFVDTLANQTIVDATFTLLNRLTNITIDPKGLISNNRVKIWYNNKGFYSAVAYLNVINNAFLRNQINKPDQTSNYGIVNINHPMPFTSEDFVSQILQQTVLDLFVAICIIFALSFIPASFLVFLLEERQSHAKQLQFVSGVKPYVYWISNYLWDLLNYTVPSFICVFLFLAFNASTYTSPQNMPCVIMIILLYGWSCIPLMYPLNYVFQVPSTAFVIASCANVFIGKCLTWDFSPL